MLFHGYKNNSSVPRLGNNVTSCISLIIFYIKSQS